MNHRVQPSTNVIKMHDMLTYGEVLQNLQPGQLMVLDFTATWCGPCRMIAPAVDQLSLQYPNVVFGKVDVDEVPELSAQYGVNAMPTFKFVRDGQVVSEFAGANRNLLVSTLQNVLSTPQQPSQQYQQLPQQPSQQYQQLPQQPSQQYQQLPQRQYQQLPQQPPQQYQLPQQQYQQYQQLPQQPTETRPQGVDPDNYAPGEPF